MIGYSKDQQLGKVKSKPTQTQRNITANEILDIKYKKIGLYDTCEVQIANNCLKVTKVSSVGTKLNLTYAHRHKRDWYKTPDKRKLLSALTETLRVCLPCHMKMEYDRKLTNQLFIKLRGTKFLRDHSYKINKND